MCYVLQERRKKSFFYARIVVVNKAHSDSGPILLPGRCCVCVTLFSRVHMRSWKDPKECWDVGDDVYCGGAVCAVVDFLLRRLRPFFPCFKREKNVVWFFFVLFCVMVCEWVSEWARAIREHYFCISWFRRRQISVFFEFLGDDVGLICGSCWHNYGARGRQRIQVEHAGLNTLKARIIFLILEIRLDFRNCDFIKIIFISIFLNVRAIVSFNFYTFADFRNKRLNWWNFFFLCSKQEVVTMGQWSMTRRTGYQKLCKLASPRLCLWHNNVR